MITILAMILKTAFTIVLVSFVARFLAQIARANFYNPLAQTVITITDPFLKPLRRIIPSIAGMDIASLFAIWFGQLLLSVLLLVISGYNPLPIVAHLAIWALIATGAIILWVIYWSMIIVAISSFILMGQYNPYIGFINQMIEPFIGPFRKLNLQVGMLDLSFIVAIFAIYILKDYLLLQTIGNFVQYNSGLFIG